MSEIENTKLRKRYWFDENVYEAAKKRIEFLFDEFPKVVCSFSGGKDSTVTLFIALEVAREKGRLPLTVIWIDQEAEWNQTVEYARYIQSLPDIDFRWYQISYQTTNSTVHDSESDMLHSWKEGDKWIREKEENSIKENTYGVDRFFELFPAIGKKDFPGKMCFLAGVRAEESMSRLTGLVSGQTYKHITYGKKLTKDQYTFYPLYDWGWRDVWKYIHSNDIQYNKIYDYQYQYGIKPQDMRVSALTHETAIQNLFYLPEVDKDLYDRLCERMTGVNTAVSLNKNMIINDLPFMFADWTEYRDFLLDKLVEPKNQDGMRKWFAEHEKLVSGMTLTEAERKSLMKGQIAGIMVNDVDGTKFKNLATGFINSLKFKHGKIG